MAATVQILGKERRWRHRNRQDQRQYPFQERRQRHGRYIESDGQARCRCRLLVREVVTLQCLWWNLHGNQQHQSLHGRRKRPRNRSHAVRQGRYDLCNASRSNVRSRVMLMPSPIRSGSPLTLGAGPYTSTGEKADHLVMMLTVGTTASGGITPSETLTIGWDEI